MEIESFTAVGFGGNIRMLMPNFLLQNNYEPFFDALGNIKGNCGGNRVWQYTNLSSEQ